MKKQTLGIIALVLLVVVIIGAKIVSKNAVKNTPASANSALVPEAPTSGNVTDGNLVPPTGGALQ